jgi:hypothetical protein
MGHRSSRCAPMMRVNFAGPKELVGQFARVSVTEGHLWGFMAEWTGRVSSTSFEVKVISKKH